MRHRKNRIIELSTGNQKRSLVLRNLLTSLVKHGRLVTTEKRAKALVSEADSFFSSLAKLYSTFEDQKDAKRECIRLVKSQIFTESEGKKVVNELLPKFLSEGKKSSFATHYKLGYRPGDGADKILVALL